MWDAVVRCNAPRRLNFTRGFGHVRLLLLEPYMEGVHLVHVPVFHY